MFGSNPFGQSSSSPFGSQPVFGQNANANTNLFAPNPFGNTAPFGTQTGSSFFGSTATGVFGNQNSSPLGSTSVFGASSSPAFGSSTSAFGASSTPAFGSTSSPFGGTSAFGQKPAFGAFGSSSGQTTSPFGSSFQQSQPAFGSSLFGSSTQSSFGNATAPAFGASSAPAFGATTNTSPFGSSGGAFGVSSSPGFGSTSPAFGAASTPAFGASSTLAFGSSNTGLFGASNASAPSFAFGQSAPAFGQSAPAFGQSTPAFGQSAPAFVQSAPAFGQSAPAFGQSAPAFGQSAPAFGQSAPAFGSSAFGTTTSSPFGGQSNQFGSQASATTFGSPGFGQSAFGSQRGGTRVTPYAATTETDAGTQPPGKLESISAMPTYKDKSHEELRWEDYQLGDKGGPAPANQSLSGVTGFGSQSTTPFGQSLAANPFSSSSNSSNPFAPKTSAFGSSSGFGSSVLPASNPFGSTSSNPFGSTSSNPFGSTSSNPFGSTSSNPFGSTSSTPSMFNSQSTAFTTATPSLFGTSNSNTTFGTSNSIFSSSLAQGTTNAFNPSTNFGNSQSSPLFQSTTPSISPFGQSTSAFGQTNAFNTQMNAFNTTSSSAFGGNIFSSNPPFGQTNTSLSTPFQTAQPAQTMNSGGFGNFGQPPAVNTVGFGGSTNIIGQSTFGQSATIQNSVAVQQAPSNPFGTLPTMPQMSIARTSNSPSVQYGISSIPVVDKPVPVRVSSFLTARHISQRRVRLPTRKYHPNVDGLKVPFFRDDEETMVTPKADAFFIPRENPRALVVHPLKPQIPSIGQEKTILSLHNAAQNGNSTEGEASRHVENGYTIGNKEVSSNGNGIKEQSQPSKQIQKSTKGETSENNNNNNNIHSPTKAGSYVTTLTSQRPAIGADIETVVPKLRDSEYYTEPRIQELAAKERSEPGYCQRVKDFTVGRHGYGSIKFIGETDVRGLDLDSLIRFNNREVIVYMDESKKPPIGQGLNKPAEVTLMNIKYISKKTGEQVTSGPMIDKYLDMLKRKAVDQGTQFVSYDPINGDWKFKVSHFSTYKF